MHLSHANTGLNFKAPNRRKEIVFPDQLSSYFTISPFERLGFIEIKHLKSCCLIQLIRTHNTNEYTLTLIFIHLRIE